MRRGSLIVVLAAVGVGLLLSFAPAGAAIIPVGAGTLTQCPTVGLAHSCALLFRFNADGSVDTLTDASVPSTDGVEDTLVGVLNLTGSKLTKVSLDGGALDIFGFDGDGGSSVVSSGPGATYFGHFDLTTVGSPRGDQTGTNTFSPTNVFKGDVNFPGGVVGAGGTGWWVLEEQVSFTAPPIVSPPGVPEPASLLLLGSGLAGIFLYRRWREE